MSKQRCLIVNGWAMPQLALKPLEQDLQQLGFEVLLSPCFHDKDAATWAIQLQQALEADVLMGWSMGGQLATLLAQACYAQTGQAKPIITLASNPQFVQSNDWPHAMTFVQFLDFQLRFSTRPEQTLKRFKHLMMQGELSQLSDEWAQFSSVFAASILSLDLHQLAWQLDLLGQLQTQSILAQYAGAQLHVFAQDDVIVPVQVAQQLSNELQRHRADQAAKIQQADQAAQVQVLEIAEASHGFVYSRSREIAQQIQHFLNATH